MHIHTYHEKGARNISLVHARVPDLDRVVRAAGRHTEPVGVEAAVVNRAVSIHTYMLVIEI